MISLIHWRALTGVGRQSI